MNSVTIERDRDSPLEGTDIVAHPTTPYCSMLDCVVVLERHAPCATTRWNGPSD